jgi:RNA polymerase sigma factor (sigma-70 family)
VFYDTYWRLIYNTAIASDLTDAEACDVVQETVISVMKEMPNFRYDTQKGSFKTWLLKLTKWRIIDQVRRRQREIMDINSLSRPSDETDAIERITDPVSEDLEAKWDQEFEENLVEAALERVKRRVDPKQYQLFDLYMLKEWTVLKIAKTMNVNPGLVYLSKHKIKRLLKKEITHLRTKIV